MKSKINRYSDKELSEFRVLIQAKIEDSLAQLEGFKSDLQGKNSNGTEDTMRTFDPEDGSTAELKTYLTSQIYRCSMQLQSLYAALSRIEAKTYGVSILTGELIPKERLLACPTAMS